MMQMGRANSDVLMRDYVDTDLPLDRLQYVAELERAWWMQFKVQNFSSLVPTYRWKEERRNMKQGDVILIQYSSMSKTGEYRIGRVIVAEPDDEDGLVRTVIVRYCLLQNLPIKDRMKYKDTVTFKHLMTSIQRIVLILPVEEQDPPPEITETMIRLAKEAVGWEKRLAAEKAVGRCDYDYSHPHMITEMIKKSCLGYQHILTMSDQVPTQKQKHPFKALAVSDQVPTQKQKHPFNALVNELSVEAYIDYARMSVRDAIVFPEDGIADHSEWVDYALRVVDDIKKIVDHAILYLNGMSKESRKKLAKFIQSIQVVTTVVANSALVEPSFNFDPLDLNDQEEFMIALENNVNSA